MSENLRRKTLGVGLAAELLAVALLAGCFATESVNTVQNGIQRSVIPNVQRFVNANPFVNNHQKITGNTIPTHVVPVNQRDLKLPLSFLLARTDANATCLTTEGDSMASYTELIHVNRVSREAYRIEPPCRPGETTPLAQFAFDDVHRHWMGVIANNRFAIVNNHVNWILDEWVTPARVAQQRDRVALVCSDDDDTVGFIAMASEAKEGETRAEGIQNIWGLVAIKKENAAGRLEFYSTRFFDMIKDDRDWSVSTLASVGLEAQGQVMHPNASGYAPGIFKFPKVDLPSALQRQTFHLKCLSESVTEYQAANGE